MWFLNSATYLPAQRNLSIWLSATPTFNSTQGSYQCVDNFSPTAFAPSKHTITCAQTLSETRYVTVVRPLLSSTPTNNNYLYVSGGGGGAAVEGGGRIKPPLSW